MSDVQDELTREDQQVVGGRREADLVRRRWLAEVLEKADPALETLNKIRGAVWIVGAFIGGGIVAAGALVALALSLPGWRNLPATVAGNTAMIEMRAAETLDRVSHVDSLHSARMVLIEDAVASGVKTDQFLLCLFGKPYQECLAVLLPGGGEGDP